MRVIMQTGMPSLRSQSIYFLYLPSARLHRPRTRIVEQFWSARKRRRVDLRTPPPACKIPNRWRMSFKKNYPFIKPSVVRAGSGVLVNKILNEARAQKVFFDVFNTNHENILPLKREA